MTTLRTIALALLLAGVLSACNRPGKPSPEYAQAREAWTALLKDHLDDAYVQPGVDEVLALLARVDPKSVDAPFAAELRRDIETGRAAAREREESLAEQLAEAERALRPPAPPPSEEPEPAGGSEAAPAVAAAAPDAGAEDAQPEDGMEATEFLQKFSRCFEYRNDSLVGGLAGGKVYGLKNLSICRDLHPGFISNSVLVFDGKISVRPSAELAPQKFVVIDGKLVPADEAEALQKRKAAAGAATQSPAP
jgi:hypothetical protein